MFLLEFQPQPDLAGEDTLAIAHNVRRNEQVADVDQTGRERIDGESGTAVLVGFQP